MEETTTPEGIRRMNSASSDEDEPSFSSLQEETFKIGIFGHSEYGKSSLISRFVSGKFGGSFLGSESSENVRRGFLAANKPCTVELYEFQLNGPNLTPQQAETLKTLDGILFLFSVSSPRSVFSVTEYKDFASKHSLKVPLALVATQIDSEKRNLSKDKSQKSASSWGWIYNEVSAKTGNGVDSCVEEMVETIRLKSKSSKQNRGAGGAGGRLLAGVPKKNINKRLKKTDSLKKVLALVAREDERENKTIREWETKPPTPREWSEIEPTTMNGEYIDILAKTRRGYTLELGRNNIIYPPVNGIEWMNQNIPFFKQDILPKEHFNFMRDVQGLGPVIVTLLSYTSNTKTKAMIRTKYGCDRIYIPPNYSTTKEQLHYIKTNHSRLNSIGTLGEKPTFLTKWIPISNSDLDSDLADIEQKEIVRRYKFGVLYQKENQKEEDEMFSNVETSADYDDFLKFLGTKIELDGWTGYTGGLDTKRNSTGTHSVYTFHEGFEIMFHVSTLLPYQESDTQRVERKRHIGNDVIVVVFKEGNQPFDPFVIKSQFNQVFVVISVEKKEEGNVYYRVGIANKSGVHPYGPFLPSPAVFKRDNDFRDFLLTKLINSERGSMFSPEFKLKFVVTKKGQLEGFFENYAKSQENSKKGKGMFSPPLNRRQDSSEGKKLTADTSSSTGGDLPVKGSEESMTEEALDALVEKCVAVGRAIYQGSLKEFENFDAATFKEHLQQMVYISVSNHFFQKNQGVLIEISTEIVTLGKALAAIQIARKEPNAELEASKASHVQEEIRNSIQKFFMTLKDFRENWIQIQYSNSPLNTKSRSSTMRPSKNNNLEQQKETKASFATTQGFENKSSAPPPSPNPTGHHRAQSAGSPKSFLGLQNSKVEVSNVSHQNPMMGGFASFSFERSTGTPLVTGTVHNTAQPPAVQAPVLQGHQPVKPVISNEPVIQQAPAPQLAYREQFASSYSPQSRPSPMSSYQPHFALSYDSAAGVSSMQNVNSKVGSFARTPSFGQPVVVANYQATHNLTPFQMPPPPSASSNISPPSVHNQGMPHSYSASHNALSKTHSEEHYPVSNREQPPDLVKRMENMNTNSYPQSTLEQLHRISSMLQRAKFHLMEPDFVVADFITVLSELVIVIKAVAVAIEPESSKQLVSFAKQLLTNGAQLKLLNQNSPEFSKIQIELFQDASQMERFIKGLQI